MRVRSMSVRRRASHRGRDMNRALIVCAALAAATAVHARAPKKPAAPAEPAENYEISDVRLGEEMSSACLPTPLNYEPYDGRNNLLIVETTDQSHAFLQLTGDCKFNTLMFASSIAAKTADGCVKAGDSIIVADSFGGAHECRISKISRWNPDATYLEEYDQG
jgi:hypothetical protein